MKFICLPDIIIRALEEILKKYQISIQQLVEASYILDLNEPKTDDIFSKTKYIIEGSNINEVKLLEKINKNKGFFEKFFNLFS